MWGWGLELASLTLSFHKCVRPGMRLWVDTKMNKTQFQISRSFQCGTIDELCTHSYNTRKKEKSRGGGERALSQLGDPERLRGACAFELRLKIRQDMNRGK